MNDFGMNEIKDHCKNCRHEIISTSWGWKHKRQIRDGDGTGKKYACGESLVGENCVCFCNKPEPREKLVISK